MAVIHRNVYIWIKIIKVKKNTWLGCWITPLKHQETKRKKLKFALLKNRVYAHMR